MKSLTIRQLTRSSATSAEETLTFENGLNVLVGRPNTGKTKWLQMLDFAFGSEKPAAEVFGDDLAKKYDRIKVLMEIAGKTFEIERRWKEAGNLSKVFVDGGGMPARDFCAELLKRLDIPLVHYPQGDPYGKRSWPELNWRSLLRHVYRRQLFWSDLADNQPTSEQQACLLQFTGIAEHLFSAEFGELVAQEKRIMELQMRREEFLKMLHEVSHELLDEEDRGVALTPESIAAAIRRVKDEIASANKQSDLILEKLRKDTKTNETADTSLFEEESERLGQLRAKAGYVRGTCSSIENRIKELEEYRENLHLVLLC